MASELANVRVAFIVSNEGIEQAELQKPWEAVEQAGGRPQLIAREGGTAQAYNHLDKADTFQVDRTTREVSADDFDALVLPGGVANGDQVRTDPAAVELVRSLTESGKPVAVICHGPWVMVEAGAVRDRTLTSWPSLQTDVRNAGGTWVDKEIQVCTNGPNTIVSSRKPADLPAFCSKLVEVFSKTRAPAI